MAIFCKWPEMAVYCRINESSQSLALMRYRGF
jgi:hypothetical protein